MRDWSAFVRRHLELSGLSDARRQRVHLELAEQLEDIYRDARARGLSSKEADVLTRRHVTDWSAFSQAVLLADRYNRRPRLQQLSEQIETVARRRGRGWILLSDIQRDVFHALRMFRRHADFALLTIITLALGIGATIAIFSVVHTALLRPPPYGDPHRLVTPISQAGGSYRLSVPEYVALDERQRVFSDLAVYEPWERGLNLVGHGDPFHLYTHRVAPGLFRTLRVDPMLGRLFTGEEGREGSDRVVLLEHDFWRSYFGGDPSILGQTLEMSDESYVVIGVMPPGFFIPDITTHAWVPLVLDLSDPGPRTSRFLALYARLGPEVSIGRAGGEMRHLSDAWLLEEPTAYPEPDRPARLGGVATIQHQSTRYARPALLILLGSVGLVLLIACSNVANLMLTRALARQKEVAVRTALGAGRGRVLRQMLTESTLLSLAGGALGMAMARWGFTAILEFAPIALPSGLSLDMRVAVFALGLSTGTGLLCGLIPALCAARVELQDSLKEGHTRSAPVGRARLRHALVVSEVALSLLLLVGAGLLFRTFFNLVSLDPGFETESIQTFRISPPPSRYADGNQVKAFYVEMLERIRATPGVEAAGAVTFVPLHASNFRRLMPEGMPANYAEYGIAYGLVDSLVKAVSPGYFGAIGIPLLEGRTFDVTDRDGSQRVLIVDEKFAGRAWPGEKTWVGKRVAVPDLEGGEHQWWTVVGVVRHALDIRRVDREIAQAYYPMAQGGGRTMHVVVKSTIPPDAILPSIRRAVSSIDANLPIYQVRTMRFYYDRAIARPRFYAYLMGIFAVLAVVLSVVGLYGVLSHAVRQQTHEIGVRMALGAGRGAVARMVIGRGMRLTAIGAGLGLAGAILLTATLRSLLFGVARVDGLTYAGVSGLLFLAALLACWIPARRAAAIDPMQALRDE